MYDRGSASRQISHKDKGYYKLFRLKNDNSGKILMSSYQTESSAKADYFSKYTSKMLTHGFTIKLFKTYS